MDVWGISGVIYLTEAEWDKAIEDLGDSPKYMMHMYDPRNEFWIYVNHFNKPTDVQIKKYLLAWWAENKKEKAFTVRITALGKRPFATATMVSDDDLRFKKLTLTDDEENQLEATKQLYLDGSSDFIQDLPDSDLKKTIKSSLASLRKELNSGKISEIIPFAKNIQLDIVNTSLPLAFATDNTALNRYGDLQHFKLIGIDYSLFVQLYTIFNYIFSCSDLLENYGDSAGESNKFDPDLIATEDVIIPNCQIRQSVAKDWYDISIFFILGHELEHAVKHLNYFETHYKGSFGYFAAHNLNQPETMTRDYISFELGADRLGRLASDYKADEILNEKWELYLDILNSPLELSFPAICILLNFYNKISLHSLSSIQKLHPSTKMRELHFLVGSGFNIRNTSKGKTLIIDPKVLDKKRDIESLLRFLNDKPDERSSEDFYEDYAMFMRILERHEKKMKYEY